MVNNLNTRGDGYETRQQAEDFVLRLIIEGSVRGEEALLLLSDEQRHEYWRRIEAREEFRCHWTNQVLSFLSESGWWQVSSSSPSVDCFLTTFPSSSRRIEQTIPSATAKKDR